MAIPLQRRHQCGLYRRQAFTAKTITRLPERLHQLNHLGAITAAPANLSSIVTSVSTSRWNPMGRRLLAQ
jgi:hypothetical protein